MYFQVTVPVTCGVEIKVENKTANLKVHLERGQPAPMKKLWDAIINVMI